MNTFRAYILALAIAASSAMPSAASAETLTFNSSTVWTVPQGVTEATFSAWGAGGGGGSGSKTRNHNISGFGGGGGGFSSKKVKVFPGESYYISVGSGGGAGQGGGVTQVTKGGSIVVSAGGGGGGMSGVGNYSGTGSSGGNGGGPIGGTGGTNTSYAQKAAAINEYDSSPAGTRNHNLNMAPSLWDRLLAIGSSLVLPRSALAQESDPAAPQFDPYYSGVAGQGGSGISGDTNLKGGDGGGYTKSGDNPYASSGGAGANGGAGGSRGRLGVDGSGCCNSGDSYAQNGSAPGGGGGGSDTGTGGSGADGMVTVDVAAATGPKIDSFDVSPDAVAQGDAVSWSGSASRGSSPLQWYRVFVQGSNNGFGSAWSPVSSGENVTFSASGIGTGKNDASFYADAPHSYSIVFEVKDEAGLMASSVQTLQVNKKANVAPSAPTVSGKQTATTNVANTFTFSSTDPDGDNISYNVYWDGNGVLNGSAGPAQSGAAVSADKAWSSSGDKTFTVVAVDSFGNASSPSSYGVKVTDAGVPSVKVVPSQTKVPVGQPVTLTWSTQYVSNCAASGAWSGSKANSGSEASSPIARQSTFTLTCQGANGAVSDSATVSVGINPTASISVYPTTANMGDSFAVHASSAYNGSDFLKRHRVYVTQATLGGNWTQAGSNATALIADGTFKAESNNYSFTNAPGNYTIRYEVEDYGGNSAFAEKQVTINPAPAVVQKPSASVSASPSTVYEGDSVSYSASGKKGSLDIASTRFYVSTNSSPRWSPDGPGDTSANGTLSTVPHNPKIFMGPGSYSFIYEVKDSSGNVVMASAPVTVLPQPVVASQPRASVTASPSVVKEGDSVSFSASGTKGSADIVKNRFYVSSNGNPQWSSAGPGNTSVSGSLSTTPHNPRIFTGPGSYSLIYEIQDASGAVASASAGVTVVPADCVGAECNPAPAASSPAPAPVPTCTDTSAANYGAQGGCVYPPPPGFTIGAPSSVKVPVLGTGALGGTAHPFTVSINPFNAFTENVTLRVVSLAAQDGSAYSEGTAQYSWGGGDFSGAPTKAMSIDGGGSYRDSNTNTINTTLSAKLGKMTQKYLLTIQGTSPSGKSATATILLDPTPVNPQYQEI